MGGKEIMYQQNPADELADLRAEMAVLKRREAILRDQILRAPEPAQGRWHRAEIKKTVSRVFDAALLPEAVRKDPRFSRERVSYTVRCVPLPQAYPTPSSVHPIPYRREMH